MEKNMEIEKETGGTLGFKELSLSLSSYNKSIYGGVLQVYIRIYGDI